MIRPLAQPAFYAMPQKTAVTLDTALKAPAPPAIRFGGDDDRQVARPGALKRASNAITTTILETGKGVGNMAQNGVNMATDPAGTAKNSLIKMTDQELSEHLAGFSSDYLIRTGNKLMTQDTRDALTAYTQKFAAGLFTDANRDRAVDYASQGIQDVFQRNSKPAGDAISQTIQRGGTSLLSSGMRATRKVGLQLYYPSIRIGVGAGLAAGGYYVLPSVAPNYVSNMVTGYGAIQMGLGAYNLQHVFTKPIDSSQKSIKNLIHAAQTGDTNKLSKLIGAKVDLNGLDDEFCTALYRAAEQGQASTAGLLIDTGADLQLGSVDQKRSPLWIAAQNGHLAVVTLLADGGAALEQADKDGLTPLRIATTKGHEPVVKKLISAGADHSKLNLTELAQNSEQRRTLLATTTTKEVAKAKNELAQNSERAYQTFHNAALTGDLDKVCAFIGAGADLDKTNTQGMTPLWLASHSGHVESALALINAKADLNKPNNLDGWTPLILAAHSGHTKIAKALINASAELSKPTHKGTTPLTMSMNNGHTEIASLLKRAGAKQ